MNTENTTVKLVPEVFKWADERARANGHTIDEEVNDIIRNMYAIHKLVDPSMKNTSGNIYPLIEMFIVESLDNGKVE